MAIVGSFQKSVTAAGTDEAIQASTFKVRNFAIKALSTNTGIMYVGAEGVSSSTGYPLSAGDAVSASAILTKGSHGSYDLNKVWLDASVNGETVAVFYNCEEDEDPTT